MTKKLLICKQCKKTIDKEDLKAWKCYVTKTHIFCSVYCIAEYYGEQLEVLEDVGVSNANEKYGIEVKI